MYVVIYIDIVDTYTYIDTKTCILYNIYLYIMYYCTDENKQVSATPPSAHDKMYYVGYLSLAAFTVILYTYVNCFYCDDLSLNHGSLGDEVMHIILIILVSHTIVTHTTRLL